MKFSEKYNKVNTFGVDTTDFKYVSLKELFEENDRDASVVYNLRGLYISHKGHYGDAPVFITDYCFVNIPKHMTKTCVEILDDAESINLIKANAVGFTIYEYVDTNYNKVCYGVKFIDRE